MHLQYNTRWSHFRLQASATILSYIGAEKLLAGRMRWIVRKSLVGDMKRARCANASSVVIYRPMCDRPPHNAVTGPSNFTSAAAHFVRDRCRTVRR